MSCCSETSAKVVKDPVCGMQVDPANAAGQSQCQGLTYSFCSLGCKKKFDLNPAQYVQSDTEQPLLQPQSVAVPRRLPVRLMWRRRVNTPVPCTPRCRRISRDRARSAAWPSKRSTSLQRLNVLSTPAPCTHR
jgi:Cu+-exporting ATPase